MLAAGRFGTDRDGYRTMLALGRRYPNRVWAVEGCNGRVSRGSWNFGDDPIWMLGGGTDSFGASGGGRVGVSAQRGDELGHLLVAPDAAK